MKTDKKYDKSFCPNKEECYEILREYGTPEHVIRHSEAVAKVSIAIGKELISKGLKININLIESASYLHDIARTKSKHDMVGAKYLYEIGLIDISEVIKDHTFHRISDDISTLNETDILCIADRMVIEDKFAGPRNRMKYIIDKAVLKFGEEKREELELNLESFVKFTEGLENYIGKKIIDIIPENIR